MSRRFLPILVLLVLAAASLAASLWNTLSSQSDRTARVRPTRQLAGTFMSILCRPPSDLETIDWDNRPYEPSTLTERLHASSEAKLVQQMRTVYPEVLRRDATSADCGDINRWFTTRATVEEARRELARRPEGRRVEQVRQLFIQTLGRDPREWDDLSLRRWVDSPFTLAEIRTRLRAQRPLVGVHYFMWYLPLNGWGNGLTSVAEQAPRPLLGPYDSSDTDVIATHITQMEEAGFDFALVHIVYNGPRTWTNARIFMDRLSGHRLKAAIVLDGLYKETPAEKAMWIERVKREFTGDEHYLRFHGTPLVILFSALIDVEVPGVDLRNMYFTSRYDPGRNTFNPSTRLEPRDWSFWEPTPQQAVNGLVPIIPGYTDAALGRTQTMLHERRNGQTYREQWQRALALHPELVVVYGWNEYFEQTAIEPTNVWGDQYLRMTACFTAHARRGTSGAC